MSPNQHKIESLSSSEVNHPSPTIVTLFKDDSNINDKIRTTATTEITTDEEEESSTEKQHTTTTSSANSSIMTGTIPAAESPQTPINSTDDNTSTNIIKDESSPGFEEFLNVLKDEPKTIDKKCTPNDDDNDNNNIDYGSKPLERRRSSDLGNEMRASNLLNSTNTVVSCSLSFLLGVIYLFIYMILMLDIFNFNTAPSNVSQCQSGFMGEQGRISPSTC